MFTVTKMWLRQNKTVAGGYSKLQVECLGVTWPPPKGWLNSVVGKEISIEAKGMFERSGVCGDGKRADKVIGMCKKLSEAEKKRVISFLQESLRS